MSEVEVKRWYQSKTVWANVTVTVAALAQALQEYSPLVAGFVTPESLAWVLFTVGVGNVMLRMVTTKAVV